MPSMLRLYIRKQQFQPGFVGLFVNPFYFARKGLYGNIAALAKNITGKTLDVGCGQKPYKDLFNSSEYIGLEIDSEENRKSKNADFFYDGTRFPFLDAEYDSMVLNEVFEHVFNPDEFLCEVSRVIKPGGLLLLTVPFVWDEHEQPYDYARYSSFGIKYLLEKHGFLIVEQRKSINDIRVIFQMLNVFIYKKTVGNNGYFNLFIMLTLMAPFNIIGALLAKLFPNNNDLYLDNIVLAKKVAID